jgi:hypothetical protein
MDINLESIKLIEMSGDDKSYVPKGKIQYVLRLEFNSPKKQLSHSDLDLIIKKIHSELENL